MVSLVMLLSILSVGCGTIMNRTVMSGSIDESARGMSVYGGIRTDMVLIVMLKDSSTKKGLLYATFIVADLPLSFVADTLLLPVTIPEQNRYRKNLQKEKKGDND